MRSVTVRTRERCPDCGRLVTWRCRISESDPLSVYGQRPDRTTRCEMVREQSACQCPWTLNAERWESERIAEELVDAIA